MLPNHAAPLAPSRKSKKLRRVDLWLDALSGIVRAFERGIRGLLAQSNVENDCVTTAYAAVLRRIGHRQAWGLHGSIHFFNPRTNATSALISSSESMPPKAFIFSLPFLSFSPSLICLNICSSVKPAWYLESVRSFTSAFLPALVSPLPSFP